MKRYLNIILAASLIVNIAYACYFLRGFIPPTPDAPVSGITYYMKRDSLFMLMPKSRGCIVFAGDSHIHHFEAEEMFEVSGIKNRGIMGDVTEGLLKRIGNILDQQPKKIFLEIGINDLLKEIPAHTTKSNILKLFDTIQAVCPHTQVYVTSILPTSRLTYYNNRRVSEDIIRLNEMLQEECGRRKLTFIDLYSKLEKDGALNPIYDGGDKIHLNGKAYFLWKELLDPYLKN